MPKVPEELQEAMELLDSYKSCKDHLERNEDFRCAFELIRDYLEDYPDTSYRAHADALTDKYVQMFLKELPTLHHLDFDDWSYYVITVASYRKEFEKVMGDYQHLKDYYDNYSLIWRDEVRKILLKE